MFITRDAFRSPISALFCEVGDTCWRAAELVLQQTWFVVSFEQVDASTDDGFGHERTMLFTDFQNVEQLINMGPKDGIHLKFVHILTPGHVNGTASWKMERLGAVWLGKEPNSEYIPMDVFETISGKRYSASFVGLTADALEIESMKFNFTEHSREKHVKPAHA